MVKARLRVADSDSSDDWEVGPVRYNLHLDCYTAAQLAIGFRDRRFRVRAIKELTALLKRWDTADIHKATRQAVFDDVFEAVQLQDASQHFLETQQQLVEAAKRVLPQQKQRQLAAALKKTGYGVQRSRRKARAAARQGAAAGDSSEEEPEQVQFTDMPLEVLGVILRSLDLVSLATAAAVSKSWRLVACADEVWLPWLQCLFKYQPHPAEATGQPQQHQQQQPRELLTAPAVRQCPLAPGSLPPGTAMAAFGLLAAAHPRVLLPWTSCRVLLGGRLHWQQPRQLQAPPQQQQQQRGTHAQQQPRQHVRRGAPAVPLSVEQAVDWLTGKPVSCSSVDTSSGSSSSDSSSSSDDEESVHGVVPPSNANQGVGGATGVAAPGGTAVTVAGARRRLRLWNIQG